MPRRSRIGRLQVSDEPTASPVTSTLRQTLALVGLTGFAFSQPVLSIAGSNPELFVFNDVTRSQILLLALLMAVVPAAAVTFVLLAARAVSSRLQTSVFVAQAVVLAMVAGVQFGRDLGLGALAFLAGVAAATGIAVGLVRSSLVRDWLSYTAILPVLAVLAFVFTSPAGDLLGSRSSVERNDIAGVEPNLVVLLLDELPTATLLDDSGRVDADLFPSFAALAESSTWYRNFTTTSAATASALPAIFTGQYPQDDPPLWTNYPDNLFQLLAKTHGLTVLESFTQLCGSTACTEAGPLGDAETSARPGQAAGDLIDLWVDSVKGKSVGAELDDFEELVASDRNEVVGVSLFADDEQVRLNPVRFSAFLDALAPTEAPHAYFLHLLLPHTPYRWFENGTQYATEPDAATLLAVDRTNPWVTAIDEHRHIHQARYADGLIGQLLERLRATGLYEDSTVVVMSDHGMAFAVGEPRRSTDDAGRAGTLYTPLFVKSAGQGEGVVDETNVLTHDLVPLIAAELGLEVDWPVEGAAPGSPETVARGTTKVFSPVTGFLGGGPLGDPVEYDATDYRPENAAHAIPARDSGDPELGPLLSLLASSDLIGESADDLEPAPGGRVTVLTSEEIMAPSSGVVHAIVQGTVDDGPVDGEVLVVVDDVIVSGSHLFTAGEKTHFVTFLPVEIAGTGFDLRVLHVAPDGTVTEPTSG